MKQFDIPKEWLLTPTQEVIIGSLLDDAGNYFSARELHEAVYDEEPENDNTPPKLRVHLQKCRDALDEISEGLVTIETKRGLGYRITKNGRSSLQKLL